jgi:multidrug efflux pump subunit AcrA (membrane-fusion protein)
MPVRCRRRGFSVRGLIIVMAVLGGVGGVVYFTFPKLSLSSQDTGPMMHTVALGDFVHDITERGNVESASNVDIRCEVESRGSQGTMILELIEEGTYVKPGDILCKLDSSSLEQEMVQQQIICNTSEAAVIQARNNYETAEIAKDEYLNGTYVENVQGVEGNIFVAEENMRRAEQTLAYTEKLFARGYVTQLAVDADDFSVKDAEQKLAEARTKKMVLEDYTRKKMLKQLEADIKTTKAKLESEEHSHTLDEEKLADVTAQVEKCTVVAPDYGQVVYANVTDRRGGSETIIEEGGSIRERQVIFRLPDPNRMQVKAKINEASVSMVDEGMRSGIRLDAFPDLELKGDVEKVNEYPVPTSFFSGNVKEYETIIRIHLPGQDEGPAEDEEPKTDADTEDASDADEPGQGPEAKPETAEDSPAEESDEAEPSPEGPTEAKPSSDDDTDGEAESGENESGARPGTVSEANELLDESGNKVQLRPGMTAEVKIRVETIPNVVQIPVQAIVEHGGKNYCLMYDKAAGWSKKEVKIGSTNDKMVVIQEGLEEGDKVVMGASKHREKVKWPKLETIPGETDAEESAPRGAGRAPGAGGRSGGGGAGGGGAGGGGAGGGGAPNPAQAFKGLDKNSDGKLTEDEAPGPMKGNFAAVDKNSDGSVDVAEFTAAMKAFSAGRGQGGAARGGPGGARPGGGAAGGGRPGGGARPGGAR